MSAPEFSQWLTKHPDLDWTVTQSSKLDVWVQPTSYNQRGGWVFIVKFGDTTTVNYITKQIGGEITRSVENHKDYVSITKVIVDVWITARTSRIDCYNISRPHITPEYN